MIIEHVFEVKQGQPCSAGTVVQRTQEVIQVSKEQWDKIVQAKIATIGQDWTTRYHFSLTPGQHLRTELYRSGKGLDAPDRLETEWWAVRQDNETVYLDNMKVSAADALKIQEMLGGAKK